jgi:hypothetical protein
VSRIARFLIAETTASFSRAAIWLSMRCFSSPRDRSFSAETSSFVRCSAAMT